MSYSPSRCFPHRIQLSIPHSCGSEMEFVREAFSSNWLSTFGPNLVALEEMFAALVGSPSVALASGTAGLHLGLKLLGVGPEDEVVTPALSFIASANPIRYESARPIFIDSERSSWNLDAERLAGFLKKRARVNRLPRAVVVVHLYGRTAEIASIVQICSGFGVPVLEDAAHALGTFAGGKQVGTWGDVGVFSFGGNKVVTASAGGMLVSREAGQVEKVRYWANQARDQDPEMLNGYYHSEIGYNYRMSNVLAGIARGQLGVLQLRLRQRQAVFERYQLAFAELPGIEAQPGVPPASQTKTNGEADAKSAASLGHTRWLSCFLIDPNRFGMSASDLIRFLAAANIETRPVWKPLHTQPLYRGSECLGGEVAEDLSRRGVCFPSSSCLAEEEQHFVIERVREAHRLAKSACR